MNFIMVTSAASRWIRPLLPFLNFNLDIWPNKILSISKGRLSMIVLTVLGTIPVFFKPEILLARTISGTMVIGLVLDFYAGIAKYPSFHFTHPLRSG